MRKLDRYILAEMILPFVAGIFAVIMMLVGNTLFALVDLILKNHIPLVVVARLVVFNIPTLMVLTMPIGVALAGALAVNRLAREGELTAIRMSGVSLLRIFRPIFAVGLAASIASFVLSEHVVPWSQREFQKTQAAMFGFALANSPSLASNRVFVYQNYNFYVGGASKDLTNPNVYHLSKVLIIENPTDMSNFPRFFTAGTADYDNGLWTLYDVVVHTEDSTGFTAVEMHPQSMTLDLRIPLPDVSADANGMAEQPESYTMSELRQKIDVMSKTGIDTREYLVAYQFKVALPFLCLAFAICAPPLSMTFARTGSFVGIFLAIVMVFVAWNTLILAKAFGVHGYLSPWLAAWAANIIFGGLGAFLLRRME